MNVKFSLLLSLWTTWAAIAIIPVALSWNLSSAFFLILYLSGYIVGVLVLYKRLVKKSRRYPLTFPRGVDPYFPRFDIPRPIYLNLAEHPEYFEEADEADEG